MTVPQTLTIVGLLINEVDAVVRGVQAVELAHLKFMLCLKSTQYTVAFTFTLNQWTFWWVCGVGEIAFFLIDINVIDNGEGALSLVPAIFNNNV